MKFRLSDCVRVICLLCSSATAANAADPNDRSSAMAAGIVTIVSSDSGDKTLRKGSGAVIDTGQVITACPVIDGARRITLRHEGADVAATLQYAARGLCQLSAPALKISAPTQGRVDRLRLGQAVFLVGGKESTLGHITQLREFAGSYYSLLSISIPATSNGGGLFDEQGRLIGIASAQVVDGYTLNTSLPIDWVTDLPGNARSQKQVQETGQGLAWINRWLLLEFLKKWRALRELSERWSIAEPDNSDAWYHLGLAYHRLGQFYKAVQSYQQALHLRTNRPDTWRALGATYVKLGQDAKAAQSHERALQLRPGDARIKAILAMDYHRLGSLDRAIELYLKALRDFPSDVKTINNLGIAYREQGQFDKAIELYRKILRIDPDKATAWYNLGNAYQQEAKEDSQLFRLYDRLQRRIRQLGPNLSVVYSDLKQYEKVIQAYQEAIRIKPDFYEAWYNLGLVYSEIFRYEQAIEVFQTLQRLHGNDVAVWNRLGLLYHETRQYESAVEAYQKALKIDPKFAIAWSNLGATYAAEGRRQEVLNIYQTLRTLNPFVAEGFYNQHILP